MHCEKIISHRHMPPEHTRARYVNKVEAGYLRQKNDFQCCISRRKIALSLCRPQTVNGKQLVLLQIITRRTSPGMKRLERETGSSFLI
jgi:hypothetical protein